MPGSIDILTEGKGLCQMACPADPGPAVCVAAAAGQKHPFVPETDVVYHSELIVGYRLLKCPEEIIRRRQ